MKKSVNFGLSRGQKAGIVFSALLFVAITVIQSSTSIKTEAQDSSASDEYKDVQPDPSVNNSDDLACTMDYNPICGTDGRTYSNECEARKQGMDVKFKGKCEDEKTNPENKEEYHPAAPEQNNNEWEIRIDDQRQVEQKQQEQKQQEQNQQENDNRQLEDTKRHLEQSRRDLENRQRELERNFRNMNVDTSVANGPLDKWRNALSRMEQSLNSSDFQGFWNTQQGDEQDARWAVDDAFQKLYNMSGQVDAQQRIKERERQLKDKEREIKRHSRDGRDVSPLENILNKMRTILGQMNQSAASSDFNRDAYEDLMMDFNDLEMDFQDVNEKYNEESNAKELERVLKDKERMIKNMERNCQRGCKVDVGPVVNKLNDLKNKIQQAYDQKNYQEAWDLNIDFDDVSRDFESQNWEKEGQDSYNDDRAEEPRNDSGDQKQKMERELTRAARDLKNYTKNIDRLKKEGVNVAEFETALGKVKAKLDEARGLMNAEDPQDFWWAFEDATHIINDELREKMDNLERSSGTERWLKDTGRMLKDMEREVARMEKQGKAVPLIYTKVKDLYKKATEQHAAGNFEDAQWTLEDLHDVAGDFWDAIEDFHQQNFKNDMAEKGKRVTEDVERGLADAKHIIEKLKGEGKDVSRLVELLDKAFRLLEELRKAVESNNGDQVGAIIDKLEFGVKEAFEKELRRVAGANFDEAWEDAYKPDDFAKQFELDDEQVEKVIERIAEKMGQKIMAKVMSKGLPSEVVKALAETGFEEEIRSTFESVSHMERGAAEIVTSKADMLQKVKEMEALAARLQQAKKMAMTELRELQAVQKEIKNYNFMGNAGAAIKQEMEEFIASAEGLTSAQVKVKIKELKAEAKSKIREARQEKFQKGIIPFLDADDNEWFSKYAAEAKQNGFVKGTGVSGGTKLDPSGLANVAEAVTLFGRAVGGQDNAGIIIQNGRVAQNLPEWAKAGAAALQVHGVDLDQIFGNKGSADQVTRAETARLMQAVFNLKPANADFPDIGEANTAEKDAIGAVNAAGIMTGEGDGSFNVKGALNRAAMVKVLMGAQELAQ